MMVNFTMHDCTFDNIWMFDRDIAFSSDIALIFYFDHYYGNLVIGDYSYTSTFKNLVGIFNDHTYSLYPDWDPTKNYAMYIKEY